jgi:hypothetical protein
MSAPPEVVFDRCLRAGNASSREQYKGKHDLEGLPPRFKPLLLALQEALNRALSNEQQVPEHVSHPPFHVDYVDSGTVNALAFQCGGYSFIGLTIGLVDSMWEVCHRLSRSEKVASLIRIQIEGEGFDALQAILFRVVLFFVVTHEYAHHVHGNSESVGADFVPFNEILDDGPIGNLRSQTVEADADAYAVDHLMPNFISGAFRPLVIAFLKIESLPLSVQDELIFSCLVVAMCGFFLLRPVPALDSDSVYRLTHPPQAARVNVIMRYAIGWCKTNRPGLEGCMNPDRFNALMTAVAETFWNASDESHKRWVAQTEFLHSPDGLEYLQKLEESLNAYIASL